MIWVRHLSNNLWNDLHTDMVMFAHFFEHPVKHTASVARIQTIGRYGVERRGAGPCGLDVICEVINLCQRAMTRSEVPREVFHKSGVVWRNRHTKLP